MVQDAFELLSRPVQKALWDARWEELRPVQCDAIRALTQSTASVLISAETAAGKTEAAFLPILSLMEENKSTGLHAIYVGPLKALINDQFERLKLLCREMNVGVTRWHGDAPSTQKKKLLANPQGVLLITPESLESLFLNHSSRLRALFDHLPFVVIDELHAFLGAERGLQLQSLLARIKRYSPKVRKVGLSATIGDYDVARRFLDLDEPDSVIHVSSGDSTKEIRIQVLGYQETDEDEQGDDSRRTLASDLLSAAVGRSSLIFANRKQDVEEYSDLVRNLAERNGFRLPVFVHHGSLAKDIREEAEARMKAVPIATAFCTSTLELGIDIGNVEATAQIGAPWSVSSFLQRLGRSGRKDGQPRINRTFLIAERPRDLDEFAACHPDILQAIAVIELMKKGWVDSPKTELLDWSTLAHQTLSLIAQSGGAWANEAFDQLCRVGPFRSTTMGQFAQLLRSLGRKDLIEQSPDNLLILGMQGERLVRNYEFYSVFQSTEDYRVLHGTKKIGELPLLGIPEEKEHLLLAGQRWLVARVDFENRIVSVRPARGRKAPRFDGLGGQVSHRIRETMFQVLLASNGYSYLNDGARRMLDSARKHARQLQLKSQQIVPLGERYVAWFTWTGSDQQETLAALLRSEDISFFNKRIGFFVTSSAEELIQSLKRMIARPIDPRKLATLVKPKGRRKYDAYISDDLLEESIATDVVDLSRSFEVIRRSINS